MSAKNFEHLIFPSIRTTQVKLQKRSNDIIYYIISQYVNLMIMQFAITFLNEDWWMLELGNSLYLLEMII